MEIGQRLMWRRSPAVAAGCLAALIAGAAEAGVHGDPTSDSPGFDPGSTGFIQFQDSKLLPTLGAAGERFGQVVKVRGDLALISSPAETHSGFVKAGSVRVYRFDHDAQAWLFEEKLIAPPGDVSFREFFGSSLEIGGDDLIVIGCKFDDEQEFRSGAAYIYRFEGGVWTLQQKLMATEPSEIDHRDDRYGWAVSMSGDALVVTASENDEVELDAGAAYVYRYNDGLDTWELEQKINPSFVNARQLFGFDAKLVDDILVVSAYVPPTNDYTEEPAIIAMRNYIYHYDGAMWNEVARVDSANLTGNFYPSGAQPLDFDGTRLAMGVWLDGVRHTGAVFTYTSDDWASGNYQPEAKIRLPDGNFDHKFGWAVDFEGDTMLVSAFGFDVERGQCHVFDFNGDAWVERARLWSSDRQFTDRFGFGMCLDGGLAVIGADQDDDFGSLTGAVYFYGLGPQGTQAVGNPAAIDLALLLNQWGPCSVIDDGCAADLNGDGLVGAADLALFLEHWGTSGCRPRP